MTKRVGANQTFYIVQDKDVKMSAKQEDIYVQVILSYKWGRFYWGFSRSH